MDAGPSTHPTSEKLQAYGSGKLDDASAEVVRKHLEDCADCWREVTAISASSSAARAEPMAAVTADEAPGESTSSQPCLPRAKSTLRRPV
jgi:anti-sigma factor RsiW